MNDSVKIVTILTPYMILAFVLFGFDEEPMTTRHLMYALMILTSFLNLIRLIVVDEIKKEIQKREDKPCRQD